MLFYSCSNYVGSSLVSVHSLTSLQLESIMIVAKTVRHGKIVALAALLVFIELVSLLLSPVPIGVCSTLGAHGAGHTFVVQLAGHGIMVIIDVGVEP